MQNAQDEDYELVELDEFLVLFTNARLNRESIPEGLFCYDIRHDDACQGVACEVSPFIGVNHWGTILSKNEIPLDSTGSYYPVDDMNYLGVGMNIEEYLGADLERIEEAAGIEMKM